MKPRICMLVSNFISVPPKLGDYGAKQRIVYNLTEDLIKKGHNITLFASGDSKTSAKLESVTEKETISNKKIKNHVPYEHLLISKAYKQANEKKFDLIHSHFDSLTAFYAPLSRIPTLCTLHSVLNPILNKIKNSQNYVSVSYAQRKAAPELNYVDNIYHGIDFSKIGFEKDKGEYLIFVARLSEAKGVDNAIKIAKRNKEKLLLIGGLVQTQKHLEFYKNKIKPFIDNKDIKWIGAKNHEKVFGYMKKAKALIFPIRNEESFGLSMIEAMACGTPVIAFNSGSVPEVVVDGKTGFVIEKDNLDGMSDAIKRIDEIDREECRKHVEKNFSLEKMVDNYEKVYNYVMGCHSKK